MDALTDEFKHSLQHALQQGARLTRDAILRAIDLRTTDIDVPEWGGSVRVRGMTAAERDAMLAAVAPRDDGSPRSDSQIKAYLCAHCIIDVHGQSLFNDDDIGQLQQKNPQVLDRLAHQILQLSGIGESSVDAHEKN